MIGSFNLTASVGRITPTPLNIITRSQWGALSPNFSVGEGLYDPVTNINGYADYSVLRPSESLATILNRITIHHVGNRIGKSQFPTVKEIQTEQINSKEYSDIAYHYAIDVQGNVYEGRPINVRGAHAAGANTGNIGIVFLRDFQSGPIWDIDPTDDTPPPPVMVDAATALITQLEVQYGIDTVVGHKDIVTGTECPGDLLAPLVPQFNSLVTP